MKNSKRKPTKMAKKNQPNRDSMLARAYLLSYPQLFVFALIFAFVGGLTVWTGLAAPASGGSCVITPAQTVLDQDWTVSAKGLPKSTVNMSIIFPDGASSTGPITANSNGTYTTTGNSNMSASWGFITPEQTGTYTYKFVGKIKYPAGSYNQSYATCTVQVT